MQLASGVSRGRVGHFRAAMRPSAAIPCLPTATLFWLPRKFVIDAVNLYWSQSNAPANSAAQFRFAFN